MADLDEIADEREILRVRRTWFFCRDQGDWETMATLFHPGAAISISWYAGDIDGFIAGSQKVFGPGKPGTRIKHWFGNYRLMIENGRAFMESDVEGRVRDYIDDHLFDLVFECRFLDCFEKRDGAWRISQWTAVYDNDRIAPVIPGSVPGSFYEGLAVDGPDAATSAWRFFLAKTGRPIRPMIVGGSEEEKALRREIGLWLQQG